MAQNQSWSGFADERGRNEAGTGSNRDSQRTAVNGSLVQWSLRLIPYEKIKTEPFSLQIHHFSIWGKWAWVEQLKINRSFANTVVDMCPHWPTEVTGTIVLSVCTPCMWMSNRETERKPATVWWNRSVSSIIQKRDCKSNTNVWNAALTKWTSLRRTRYRKTTLISLFNYWNIRLLDDSPSCLIENVEFYHVLWIT